MIHLKRNMKAACGSKGKSLTILCNSVTCPACKRVADQEYYDLITSRFETIT